jgi:hypothetical protein
VVATADKNTGIFKTEADALRAVVDRLVAAINPGLYIDLKGATSI